jgi:hypothetical protein
MCTQKLCCEGVSALNAKAPEHMPRDGKSERMSGWIGVDLDGTLAHYEGWNGGKVGRPIPAMAERVRNWLAEGREVRIMTARVSGCDEETAEQVKLIQAWTKEHLGATLEVTNKKDFAMIELWDDRAVQVEPNTGRRVDGR